MLEGLTTFMDCFLKPRASNVVGNEVGLSRRHQLNISKEDVLCQTPLIAVVIV